jgi:hypothetical protein
MMIVTMIGVTVITSPHVAASLAARYSATAFSLIFHLPYGVSGIL